MMTDEANTLSVKDDLSRKARCRPKTLGDPLKNVIIHVLEYPSYDKPCLGRHLV